MSKHTYKEIVKQAKECRKNVKKEYRLGMTARWGYYFARAIVSPKKDIQGVSFGEAPSPGGTSISRQVPKADYFKLAKDLISFVEKHERLPNYLTYKGQKIRTRVYVHMFAGILEYYDVKKVWPGVVNVNFKVFYKPVETKDKVYDYFVDETGLKPRTMDEILSYVQSHFSYQYYFDDHKSNYEVIHSRSGNCTDLLQMLVNMLLKLGYDVVVIHVQCRVSGDGHVRLKARHKKYSDNEWVYRDVACVANGGDIKCNWCMDGTVLAVNPSWFMENLNR